MVQYIKHTQGHMKEKWKQVILILKNLYVDDLNGFGTFCRTQNTRSTILHLTYTVSGKYVLHAKIFYIPYS